MASNEIVARPGREGSGKSPQRGAIAVLIALLLPLLLCLGALGVDMAYLYLVKAQLDTAATAGALACAGGLWVSPAEARLRARTVAGQNKADGKPVAIVDGDIQLGKWNNTTRTFTVLTGTNEGLADSCRVSAALKAARGTGVGLYFANALGIATGDVGANAIGQFGTSHTWDVMISQDITGSFNATLPTARGADVNLLSCVRDHTNIQSEVGMVSYTGVSQVQATMQDMATGYASLEKKINALRPCDTPGFPRCGGTNIAAGIDGSVAQLDLLGPNTSDIGRAIVIVSDGEPETGIDNPGKTVAQLKQMAIDAANRAAAKGYSIFTVYFAGSGGGSAGATFLASLVRGKGNFHQTPNASELHSAVWQTCASLPVRLVQAN